MKRDEMQNKETLGEKIKDKAHKVEKDVKEGAEKMTNSMKKGAHNAKEKVAEKMDEMKENKKETLRCFLFFYSSTIPKLSFSVAISSSL